MQAIAQMLTENTGRNMLDSGGAYGRHWERNQGRNFEVEPATSMHVDWCREGDEFRPDVTHNVYHWLKERTSEAPELDAMFQAYAEAKRDSDHELAIMESFVEMLDATGLYGEGEPMTINTYNGECLLSQTLQFTYFEHDGDAYIILQVHGGCDVRGGYTVARVFAVDEQIFDYARATIYAEGEGAFNTLPYWYSDDGWNFYHEGAAGLGAGKELSEYRVSYDPAHKGDGEHVYVDEDANKAYCPLTGQPLAASY